MISKKIELVAEKKEVNQMSIQDLEQAPDSYFLEIKVNHLLELSEKEDILTFVCKKIKSGGKLVLRGFDISSLCKEYCNGNLNINQMSDLVGQMKRTHSAATLKEMFKSKGWTILFAGINDSKYLIEVIR